jgi:cytoskeletal protein RodZ
MRVRLATIICAALAGLAVVSPPALAQQKTVNACESEWRANRAEYQAKGITQKAYVAQCRAGGVGARPATATAPAPPSATKPAPAATTAPIGANQFSTEAQAKARCRSDTVVWVNLDSHIYHFPGYKSYGHTKKGAYMCEKGTAAAGFHAAKNEKHP